MAEEMSHHVQGRAAEFRAQGETAESALQHARRDFGRMEQIKESVREEHGFVAWEQVLHDLRFAARVVGRSLGFALLTVAILAIGIGATTALFSIVNGVVLQPLDFPDSGRLVILRETRLPQQSLLPVSARTAAEWRRSATSVAGIAIFQNQPFVLTGQGEALRRFLIEVSPDYFPVLGVPPMLGRTITADDEREGRRDIAVLNYKLWVSQFNLDRGIVGRKIILNNTPVTVIGVMPKTFLPEDMTDPWMFMPLKVDPRLASSFQARVFKAVARIKPGFTVEQAREEFNVIAGRLAFQYPDTNKDFGVAVTPALEAQVGSTRSLLFVLLGAVAVVLVIACVNVANLTLARATARSSEIAVRVALGASRGRIVRQLLVESLLISCLGAALGVGLAYFGKDLLLQWAPVNLPRAAQVSVDGAALALACGLSVLTGVGFGLAPAIQSARVDLPAAMKDGGRSSSDGTGRLRVRSFLVVVEVALAVVLLLNAGLLVRSFQRLQAVDVGYEVGKGVTHSSNFILTAERYRSEERLNTFADEILERVGAVPGVRSVCLATAHPMFFRTVRIALLESRPELEPKDLTPTNYYAVTPPYFEIFGIRLKNGRLFDRRDGPKTTPVALVSEEFVRRNFPGQSPLGQRIKILGQSAWHEIVGVVTDIKEEGPAGSVTSQVYAPYAQSPDNRVNLIFRLDHPMANIRPALRAALDAVDPDLPFTDMKNGMDLFWQAEIANQRFALRLFGAFSLAALFLSALGIYGVIAYAVTRRRQEIGIRMALGAQAKDILALIFSQSGRMIAWGLVVGLAGSLVTTRVVASLLFGVSAFDPVTFLSVPVILGAVGFFACWLPARRALRIDPATALRSA